jgi:hypothetical protein
MNIKIERIIKMLNKRCCKARINESDAHARKNCISILFECAQKCEMFKDEHCKECAEECRNITLRGK